MKNMIIFLLLITILPTGCGYTPEEIGQVTINNHLGCIDIDELWIHKIENGCGGEYLSNSPIKPGYTMTLHVKDCVALEFYLVLSDHNEIFHYDTIPDNMRLVLNIYPNYIFIEVMDKY